MFFSKNYFRHKKLSKELEDLLFFEPLCQYIWLKNLIAGLLESVKILPIFSNVTFYFWKSSVCGLEKPIVAIIARKVTNEKIDRFLTFW